MPDDIYNLTADETEEIAAAINHYLQPEYWRITDVYQVIEARELVDEENMIWAYRCPCQNIYLDTNCYAVDFGRQYIQRIYYNAHGEVLVDENGQIDTNPDMSEVDHYTAKVYYDFRAEIPTVPVDFNGDTSLTNVLTYIGEYEWQRETSGGGGVKG